MKLRDLGPFERKCYKNWQNDPVPPETAHPGSPIELSVYTQLMCLEQLMAIVGCCAGSLRPQMASMSPPWARAFRTPVEGARLGGRRRLSP